MGRRGAVVAAAGIAGWLALAIPRLRNWGATAEEQSMALPGDDLIPGARVSGTMAATIVAPPSAVWPWLVQMGCDRAGFYSWDRLDNGGRPSARRIHPEWQDLNEGDRVLATPDGSHWFDVALVEPERTLVLRAPLGVPGGRPFDPSGTRPRAFSDSTWSFHLRRTDGDATRLLVRACWSGRPRLLLDLGNRLFWDPAHLVMQARQFAELRRRATRPQRVSVA
jgi:proline iminopeptidase